MVSDAIYRYGRWRCNTWRHWNGTNWRSRRTPGKGFDMRVLYHNRSRKPEAEEAYGFEYAELDDLLMESDFIVILAPFTPETVGLIGARELGLMKNTAALINVARGGIVDEVGVI